ncbi:MAG: hypothetical protein L6Q83_02185 [Gammaproteobacteria bacterium]|nr:hypothetical protein [Gammaproteobacteria bacterium]
MSELDAIQSVSRRRGGITALAIAALAAATVVAQEDHSRHQHGGAVPMDAEGRRLVSYDVRHEMSPADMAGLRAKVALYRGMTDRELEMNMNAMGPDYSWYVSDPGLKGDTGVLILAHGVGENSDRAMKKTFETIGAKRPTAIGFGMSMMSSAHLQAAVDDLVARGVKKIVLVDEGTTSEHNSLSRHWKYIFGMHPEPSYLEVPKVTAPGVKFAWTGHFDDSPLITGILYEHAKSVSRNPPRESLIIVGHGPEDSADNTPDLAILQAHVDRIAAKKEFAEVRIINLQDDAIKPIRESNVRTLRKWVQQAARQGNDVIVVAIAAASWGVQNHIRQDLRGLEYTFAEQGLSENPKFLEWVAGLIEEGAGG